MKKKGLISRVLRKLRDEKAGEALIFVIVSLPFIFLMFGMSIDLTKNYVVKGEYSDIAQEAAQAAIKAQNGDGSIDCRDAQYGGQIGVEYGGIKNTTAYPGLSGIQNAINDPNTPTANRIVLRTYLQKTGRSTSASLKRTQMVDNNGESIYRNDAASAFNDAAFVSAVRRYMHRYGSVTETVGQDWNSAQDAADSDMLHIAISCSQGVSDMSGIATWTETGTNSKDGTVGKGNLVTQINVTADDWAPNYILGIFGNGSGIVPHDTTSDWWKQDTSTQKFHVNRNAISSYSYSATK